MKKPTKAQQAAWKKGNDLYDSFVEYISFVYDVHAHKKARTPRTNTLELFAATKDRKTLGMLMLAEYLSNQSCRTACCKPKRKGNQ